MVVDGRERQAFKEAQDQRGREGVAGPDRVHNICRRGGRVIFGVARDQEGTALAAGEGDKAEAELRRKLNYHFAWRHCAQPAKFADNGQFLVV